MSHCFSWQSLSNIYIYLVRSISTGKKEGDRDLNNQKLHVLITSKNVTFLLCLFVFLPIREFFIHMETSSPFRGCIIWHIHCTHGHWSVRVSAVTQDICLYGYLVILTPITECLAVMIWRDCMESNWKAIGEYTRPVKIMKFMN